MVINTTATIITVFEHQVLSAGDFADDRDFTWLLDQDFEVFSLSRSQGQWGLRVRHYIGVVRLPSGALLEILPKIAQPEAATAEQTGRDPQHLYRTRAWVQRMLAALNTANPATLRVKHLSQLSPQLQQQAPMSLPISEWLLAEFVELLGQYDPLRQYTSQDHNSSRLQGKLLIRQQLQHNAHQPHRFYSEITQLTQQSLSNRFIKHAWQLVASIVLGPQSLGPKLCFASIAANLTANITSEQQSLRARAHSLLTRWQAIALLTPVECQRLQASYDRAQIEIHHSPIAPTQKPIAQRLLALSYWLLSANTQAHAGAGIQPSANLANQLQLSLFINMHHAFEAWVSGVLTQQFYQRDPQYQVQLQPQRPWLVDETGAPCVTVVPDLYVRYQQQPSHIIDMKWKAMVSHRDIKASDAYQLAAYAQAYQVRKVWLVYPVSRPSLAADANEASEASESPIAPMQLSAKGSTQAAIERLVAATDFEIWLVPFNVDRGEVVIFNENKYCDLF